jgi:putative ABC transport system ATP-binding protein
VVMEGLNRTHTTTFVFSSHNPQVMERAHRVIRLRDGQTATDEPREGNLRA